MNEPDQREQIYLPRGPHPLQTLRQYYLDQTWLETSQAEASDAHPVPCPILFKLGDCPN